MLVLDRTCARGRGHALARATDVLALSPTAFVAPHCAIASTLGGRFTFRIDSGAVTFEATAEGCPP